MLASPASSSAAHTVMPGQHVDADPLVLYARSLHDYTLRLWTESRRIAEEKARIKAATQAHASVRKLEEEQKRTPIRA